MAKIALMLLLFSALLVALVPALPPARSSQIAFESYRDSSGEIYLLDTVTGISQNLTRHEAFDGRPAWSSDGRRLAFVSNRTDNLEIFVMSADGGSVYNLTRHISDDTDPTWSPDGAQIAFISRREGNSEIYIMDVAAILDDPACAALPDVILQNPTQACAPPVRRLTDSAADETSPAWSPDGRRIAFVQETDQDSEIFAISVRCPLSEGCPPDRYYNLSDDPARDRFPAWSPDGRWIAFASNRGGTWDIYVMNADGAQIQRLTDSTGRFVFPAWSPDGRQLVFMREQHGEWAMYTCSVEVCTSNMRRLTYNSWADFQPVWRP